MMRWFQQARPGMRADLLHHRVLFLDYEAKLQYGLGAQWERQGTLRSIVNNAERDRSCNVLLTCLGSAR